MKILCLSDLHRYSRQDFKKNQWLTDVVAKTNPDIVVITGDIYEATFQGNPYRELGELIEGIPVICTLGNHECIYRTVEETLKVYGDYYNPDKYNVHYLDIIRKYDFTADNKTVRFVGNALWYDGTLSTVANQDMNLFAGGRWIDILIKNFDFREECEKCKKDIVDNLSLDKDIPNILCTHCVPHHELNGHMLNGENEFNAYSGVYDLLSGLENVDFAICGHTHWRIVGKQIGNCGGINCGNDYYPPYLYFLLDI